MGMLGSKEKQPKPWMPREKNGWTMAHNALRLDMSEMERAMATLRRRVEDGSFESWMADNFAKWWAHTCHNVHEHHDNEEEIFFPWMAKRVTLPEKVSADHKTLVKALDVESEKVQAFAAIKDGDSAKESRLQALKEIEDAWKDYAPLMREHLLEEEEEGIPLLEQNFTVPEMEEVVAVILKRAQWDNLPWYLRPLPLEEKKAWMTNEAHIPGIIQKFVIIPRFKKYDDAFTRLVEEIEKPELRQSKAEGGWLFGLLGSGGESEKPKPETSTAQTSDAAAAQPAAPEQATEAAPQVPVKA